MRSLLARLTHWWQRLVGAPEPDLGIGRHHQPDPQLGSPPRFDPRWPVS